MNKLKEEEEEEEEKRREERRKGGTDEACVSKGTHMVGHCKARSPGSCLTDTEGRGRFQAIGGSYCVHEAHDDLEETGSVGVPHNRTQGSLLGWNL